MKLTLIALDAINKKKIRLLLAIALGVTEQTIISYIRNNNDVLTKAASLEVIKNETGLSEDEILEREEVKA